MLKNFTKKLSLIAVLIVFSAIAFAAEEKVVNVFNWSDYIAEDTLALFEKETGIKVVYDVFDSNEVLETKLLAGGSGFDVVFPSHTFLGKQIKAGVFMPLDRSKIPNHKNMDPALMKIVETVDKGNQHALIYMWGTTGFGYNVNKIKNILGNNAPVDSWDMLFKPEYVSKLKQCGVSLLDAGSETIPVALQYLGLDPNSHKKKDYQATAKLMKDVRPHVTYFHSSRYINDLANGDICIALGWSGDIIQAQYRAEEAANGVEIAYVIPKEGAPLWFDMMAIPKDAPHPNNAHKFMNFIMKPAITAGISNYVAYANANEASYPLIDKAITEDEGIYPNAETKKNLFLAEVLPPKVNRIVNRTWTKIKTGQ